MGALNVQPTPVQIVHRDLKTCNVMLSDPVNRVPKIIDLGLAKEQGTGHTTVGVGTKVHHEKTSRSTRT